MARTRSLSVSHSEILRMLLFVYTAVLLLGMGVGILVYTPPDLPFLNTYPYVALLAPFLLLTMGEVTDDTHSFFFGTIIIAFYGLYTILSPLMDGSALSFEEGVIGMSMAAVALAALSTLKVSWKKRLKNEIPIIDQLFMPLAWIIHTQSTKSIREVASNVDAAAWYRNPYVLYSWFLLITTLLYTQSVFGQSLLGAGTDQYVAYLAATAAFLTLYLAAINSQRVALIALLIAISFGVQLFDTAHLPLVPATGIGFADKMLALVDVLLAVWCLRVSSSQMFPQKAPKARKASK